MKKVKSIFLGALMLLSMTAMSQQIKLPRDYQYYFKQKEISFNKALGMLQTGNFNAKINETEQRVDIRKTESVVGKPFPYKSFEDVNGKVWTVDEMKGKTLVVNYWFVGCRPCLEEMPELNEMIKAYVNKPVVFLALANDPQERVEKFLAKRNFEYVVVPDEMNFGMNLGVRSYPTHMFVNPDGTIDEVFSGQFDGVGKKIARRVDKILAKWEKK